MSAWPPRASLVLEGRTSHLSHLECVRCGSRHEAEKLQQVCTKCRGPLWARYDLAKARQDIDPLTFGARPPNLWRYAELLPVQDERFVSTLGEGGTPLLHMSRVGADLGLTSLLLKDEGQNPTGTVKARGLGVAVSRNHELGARKLAIASSGNAGGALAAYAACAGLEAFVVLLESTPAINRAEVETAGAKVHVVAGTPTDAHRHVDERLKPEGYFDVGTFREPYRLEGKKTIGFEIAEALGWNVPDVIVVPTGGGTNVLGLLKAFDELEGVGLLSPRRPRLVAAQPQGCAPVVEAMKAGRDSCTAWEGADTVALHIRVPKPIADKEILAALRKTGGRAVAVSDDDIRASIRTLAAKEGVLPGPEGAAGLAALRTLVDEGWVEAKETVVLLNTGAGIKAEPSALVPRAPALVA